MLIKNKRIKSIIRWLLSLIAIFFVWRMIKIDELVHLFTTVKFQYIIIALSISVCIRFLITFRWSLLLSTQGYQISATKLLKMLVISDAMGMFIPSNISREGIKAFLLWKYIGKAVDSFTSIFFDRFNGLLALTGIAFICSLMASDTLNNSKYIYLSGALFGFCVLVYSMMFVLNNTWISEKIQSIKLPFFHKLKSKLPEIATSFSDFTKHKRTLITVLGISIVVQLLRIFFIFCMTIALGIHIPVLYLFVILPITMLLLMLPISVGGIGIQEAAYIYFFAPFGVPPEECVALSLLCYTAVILWLLIGWSVYAKEGIVYRNGDMKDITSSDYTQ